MTTVLVTGCSSGIGRATALRLAREPGLTVYATARRPQALADLAAAGCRTLALDVTDEASMAAAVSTVTEQADGVDVLVNNAGYGEYGTVEQVPLERVRAQFETNVFGPSRLIQLVLPGMRARRRGRIVNVSSMGGRLVFPAGGYYHASKYAVEALSDALRYEVAPFGVDVIVVEPGLIRTGFGAGASASMARDGGHDGPYADLVRTVDIRMDASYRSRLLAAPPEAVAEAITHAVTARRPRRRYVVTAAAKALVHTRRLLGAGVFDRYLRLQFRG